LYNEATQLSDINCTVTYWSKSVTEIKAILVTKAANTPRDYNLFR